MALMPDFISEAYKKAPLVLFIVPVVYSIANGSFKKAFWFTWVTWSIVIFLNGLFIPSMAVLFEKATGEVADYDGFGFILGLMVGWLPGLIFASGGEFIHNVLYNIFKKER